TVIFKGISRFARSTQEALDVLDRLKAKGLRVLSYEENYDSVVENSNFMFTMHAAIAEYEAEKTGIRVRLGNKAKTQQGGWCGSPPDGYKLVNKKLAVDETRSGIIQRIFHWYSEGQGSSKVAQQLNSMGVPSSEGHLWCSKTVRDILRNRAYMGTATYNKTRQRRVRDYASPEEGRKKWVRETNQDEEWVIVEDAHQAIIEKETFYRVQQILSQQSNRKTAPRASHLLTGLLFCAKCGKGMVCQKRTCGNRVYRYYICKTYHQYGRSHCEQANIPGEDLEKAVIDRVEERLTKEPEWLSTREQLEICSTDQLLLDKELRKTEHQLAQLNQDTVRLFFERSNLADSQYEYLSRELKERTLALKNRKEELVGLLERRVDQIHLEEEIRRYTQEFFALHNMEREQLRKLLPCLISRIVLRGMEVDIHYTFDWNL
ncbi:MAG TPA: recombinase family protein, partial [Bacillota bacterium]|nr:recombinase family protein [Bacillota bacterium]